MSKHPFIADPDLAPDLGGRRLCMCGLIEHNRAHELPDRSDEERDLEARRMGEQHR